MWLVEMNLIELYFKVVHSMRTMELVQLNCAVKSQVLASFNFGRYMLNALVISFNVASINLIFD